MDIFQFWDVYRTVRKKDLFLARVRVSSPYFPVMDCMSYSCARKRSWVSLWLGLAVDIFQFWYVFVQYAIRTSCFSLGLGLTVSIFQFWIAYYKLRNKELVALAVVRVSSGYIPVLGCISYSSQEGLPVSR